MFGFEMAYLPNGPFYVATSRQVVSDAPFSELHNKRENLNISIQTKIDENKEDTVNNEATEIAPEKRELKGRVMFPFDSYIPFNPKKAKQELNKFIGQEVDIYGYASREGGTKYNKVLSKKRADKVAKIAKRLGVHVHSITAIGSRKCTITNKKYANKCRKVEVITDGN